MTKNLKAWGWILFCAKKKNIVVWGITHLLETMTIGYHLSELQVVNESVERRIDGVEAVHKYVGKTEQSDDLTLLSIRYK